MSNWIRDTPVRQFFLLFLTLFFRLDRKYSMHHTCKTMQWTEPQIEEISLGCEINSYACAEI